MANKIDFDEKNNKISLEIFVSPNPKDDSAKNEENARNINIPPAPLEKPVPKKNNINAMLAIVSVLLVSYGHFAKDIFDGNIFAMGGTCFALWVILKVLSTMFGARN